MRGRKPKPTEIKRLEGNPGRRPLNEDEPQYGPADMRPPRTLGKSGRREWKRLTRMMGATGVFTAGDRDALMLYCGAYEIYEDARAALADEGMVITNSMTGARSKNPWVEIMNKSVEQMTKLASEFGLTPASRSRIKAVEPKKEQSLAEILFEGVNA